MKAPFKLFGGKHYLYKFLLDLIPISCTDLVEVFGGSGIWILNAPNYRRRVYNDINNDFANVFQQLKLCPKAIQLILENIGYSEQVFRFYKNNFFDHGIGQAIRTIILQRFSRSGIGQDFSNSTRQRGNQDEGVNAWQSFLKELPSICKACQTLEIYNTDFRFILSNFRDQTKALLYLDPPYYPSSRTVQKVYQHELIIADHIELVQLIKQAKCKILLSGYRNQLYDEQLTNFNRVDVHLANHSGQSKKKQQRVESIWRNY